MDFLAAAFSGAKSEPSPNTGLDAREWSEEEE